MVVDYQIASNVLYLFVEKINPVSLVNSLEAEIAAVVAFTVIVHFKEVVEVLVKMANT